MEAKSDMMKSSNEQVYSAVRARVISEALKEKYYKIADLLRKPEHANCVVHGAGTAGLCLKQECVADFLEKEFPEHQYDLLAITNQKQQVRESDEAVLRRINEDLLRQTEELHKRLKLANRKADTAQQQADENARQVEAEAARLNENERIVKFTQQQADKIERQAEVEAARADENERQTKIAQQQADENARQTKIEAARADENARQLEAYRQKANDFENINGQLENTIKTRESDLETATLRIEELETELNIGDSGEWFVRRMRSTTYLLFCIGLFYLASVPFTMDAILQISVADIFKAATGWEVFLNVCTVLSAFALAFAMESSAMMLSVRHRMVSAVICALTTCIVFIYSFGALDELILLVGFQSLVNSLDVLNQSLIAEGYKYIITLEKVIVYSALAVQALTIIIEYGLSLKGDKKYNE